jgi:hypothetical protein
MKPTSLPPAEVVGSKAVQDFDDDDLEFLKDVYFPDLPDESGIAHRLRIAFTTAGYKVRTIEECSTHPTWIIKAVRTSAPKIRDYTLFLQHIQILLRGAGFRLRRKELVVDQIGDRILVAFPSGKPAANVEDILRETEEDVGGYPDLVLDGPGD